ncbi:endonuclease/exonuclease/phosphatase family protein [Paracoccus sp. MC1862]|nr:MULTISPECIES: endonuclease/exonuclease/phosphatase family protein [unclassified Paracoccus (in: a-proteobacteria)]MBB1490169.1 endonuclease/exonuclease/phosphatase family protein [Paracoccus sp. MC1854]MBB1498843.1 endonuclease/exonuclease/phosphatase family protein [Paracoccus sp. MC1862]QQO46420.1 endonuclease/exonuclease/phosphatase family protein [Paracoccus sp. MC1862]
MRRLALALALASGPALADTIRIASYSPDLSRDGPGLLLRDILSGKDEQVAAAVQVIAAADADVLLLTGFDWDHDGAALSAFADLLEAAGAGYPHRHASRPNSGMATGLDLDGDGRTGTGDDAQGFGLFSGQGGMALLSRLPLGEIMDHSGLLWRDLPGNLMLAVPAEVAEVQRLSSTAHWDVQVLVGGAVLHLLAFSATPPVFDDPETDRNGRRNHDEIAFWTHHLPAAPFVILGDFNLDPVDGDGRREVFDLLWPHVQETEAASRGGFLAPQDGANAVQKGDPARDTAQWSAADGPGSLRVDFVLPAKGLTMVDAGVLWPAPGEPLVDTVATASRHRLVWVDLDFGAIANATAASSPRPSP